MFRLYYLDGEQTEQVITVENFTLLKHRRKLMDIPIVCVTKLEANDYHAQEIFKLMPFLTDHHRRNGITDQTVVTWNRDTARLVWYAYITYYVGRWS